MYVPPAFRETDRAEIHAAIHAARLANFVTCTPAGLVCTALPFVLNEAEGEHGVLYGHLAKANDQWRQPVQGEALAVFNGPDAYVSPSWYATKAQTHKVVPTWDYIAVHAYGPPEFFEDQGRLLDVVTRLTTRHERDREKPWAVSDAPAAFIEAHLNGIIGLRLPITRLEASRKLSQNRNAADRAGVIAGLSASHDPVDRRVATLIPR